MLARIRSRLGFRAKIYLGIISILVLLGISLSVVISRITAHALLAENRKRGAEAAVNLAARVAEPMLALDFLTMKELIDEVVRSSDDISYAFVLDRDDNPLVHTFKGGFPVDMIKANVVGDGNRCRVRLLTDGVHLFYDFAAPILIAGDRLGTVRMGMSRDKARQTLNKLVWVIMLVTGAGICIAAGVATVLARTVTRKVALLRRSAKEVIKGNLDVKTASKPYRRCWELMECDRTECPAYGDERRRCWYLAGTLCPLCVEGEYAKKIESCRHCKVFRANAGDELQDLAEYFDVMALTLKDRLQALKATEQRLSRQQQVFRTILDVTPDIVCLQDRESRYRAVSKAFCRFFGLAEEQILGKSDFDLFRPDVAQTNRSEDLQVIFERRPLQMEKRVKGIHDTRWFHVVKTPVFDEQGNVIGVLCNERDITEFKGLQERIAQSQKLESLGQLAAGIAHEINTPLGIILGYVQLMLEDAPADSEFREDLELMEKHCRICRKIVADLLRFSRHTESVKRPLNLNMVLEQVLSVVEHSFALDRVRLDRHFSEGLPLVFGDQEKLVQVFMNLLTNAYQAIGSDGRIEVSTRCADNEVIVSIKDNGEGIPPEIRSRVFDPFFTTKGVGKGTGLGLSVSFGIIKDHGGTIKFDSVHVSELNGDTNCDEKKVPEHSGTTFVCRFPIYMNRAD